jgi:DNA-binding NtrC family response regulator
VAEALAMLKQDQGFDAAVFDHDLPDGKGEQVLAVMSECGIDLPVVYLSAAASSLAYLKETYSTVKQLIKKPCQPEALVSTLQTLLSDRTEGKEKKRNRIISDTERNMILGAFDHEFQDE